MTTDLALDLGTKCGVACSHKGQISVSHWNFTPLRGGGAPHHYGTRFRKFAECLATYHRSLPLDRVFYEEVHAHKGTRAAHIYGGYLAVLAGWAEANGILITGVGVGTIKRRITGKGNASKQQVMKACEARGHAPQTFDEADALALLLGVLELESACA